MSEWKEYKLDEIGWFNNGINKNKSSFGYGFPFVNLLDIFDKETIEKIPKGLVAVNDDELKRYNVREGDILFVRSSVKLDGVGKVCVALKDLENTIYSGFIIRFRQPELYIDKRFASYYLNGSFVRRQIIAKATLSANSNVNQESLKTVLINIPELPEQRKIARILSTADAVIEKTQAAIAKYKAIKQGMLHDLFTRGIDPATNKLRPTYQDAPELYKESKLGWIPRGWEVEKFQKICDLITDGSHFSPTPIEDGAIIANVKDMREFGIDYESCTRISTEEFVFIKKQNCSPKMGDVLLSKDGTIGRVVLFNDYREIVILSSIAILRPSLLVNSEYLYGFLKSEYFDKQLLVKTSGSALKRIVLRDINTLLLAYPQKNNEQKNISNRIIQIESKLQTEQTYLHKLQQIKAGLMADLLSGKKDVTTT